MWSNDNNNNNNNIVLQLGGTDAKVLSEAAVIGAIQYGWEQ